MFTSADIPLIIALAALLLLAVFLAASEASLLRVPEVPVERGLCDPDAAHALDGLDQHRRRLRPERGADRIMLVFKSEQVDELVLLFGIVPLALALIALAGGSLAYRQRADLRREFKARWNYYLLVEALFLAFFLAFLLVRIGNPDLWHPAMGGERPMDFAYLNAVIKSTEFPPYDPWFAGGYLNYYYFVQVMAGTLIKLISIVPAVTVYSIFLPPTCSGDMYDGVPITMPVRVLALSITLAMPKSVNTADPSGRKRMFSGLISLWTMPFS